MGYTHYWRRPKTINEDIFKAVVKDFRKLMPELESAGCKLADWEGNGSPQITDEVISFNGPLNCGHQKDDALIIPWPTDDAGGIAKAGEDTKKGTWLGEIKAASIQKRCCNGNCSYETFVFNRKMIPESYETPENGRYFAFCKTAFRPYDLAVISCLIIIKHHCGDAVRVASDGTDEQWFDGKLMCQMHLGYGMEYATGENGLESEEKPAANLKK